MKTVIHAVLTVILALVQGCASTTAYQSTVNRMNQVSKMNTAIVQNGLSSFECPAGYEVAHRHTDMGKDVWAEYEEEYGSGRSRSRTGYPHQEFEAGDETYGRGDLSCVKIGER